MAKNGALTIKSSFLRPIAALAFLIATFSFADVISAKRNAAREKSPSYSGVVGGTPTPTNTPTATPTPAGGTVSLSSSTYDVGEGHTALIRVMRTAWVMGMGGRVISSDGTAVGGTTCSPGVDYIHLDQYVSFGGLFDTFREVLLVTCPDSAEESDETVQITLETGNPGPTTQAVLTIHPGTGTPTPSPSPTPPPACAQSYTYSNDTPIVINDRRDPEPGAPGFQLAYPFPSRIEVTEPLLISSVSIKLLGLNHSQLDDIDLLLVGPGGENAIVLSDVGGNGSFAGVDVILDDRATKAMPDEGPLDPGFYQPTNIGGGDTFSYGPLAMGGSSLSTFYGTLADGSWSLYAVDDSGGHVGSLARGWEITFNVCPAGSPTPTPTLSPTPTPVFCASSGVLDLTFGNDGKVSTPILVGYDEASAVAIQPDEKIVAVGQSRNGDNAYFAVARFNPDGGLDTTFGRDGIVTTSMSGRSSERATAVAIQPDGKIVITGIYHGPDPTGFDFALVRYEPNGTRDITFGGDGKVTANILGAFDSARAVAILPDGKIIAAGSASGGSNDDFAVARFNSNGSLDTTFGVDGKMTTAVTQGFDHGNSVAIQPDGKIVVAGESRIGQNRDFALVRYNPDGSLDLTFDEDGKLTTPVLAGEDDGRSVAIQPDGRILVAGSAHNGSNRDFAIVRYNSDGSLDPTFGADGKVTTPVLASWDDGYSVSIQPDGRIVMAGASYTGSNYDFAVVRYNTDGTLDTTFDSDGKLTTPVGNQHDYAFAHAIRADGRIVAVGSRGTGTGSSENFALVRYGGPCSSSSNTAPFDYDADGRTDISVFRPAEGSWYLDRSSEGFYAAQFGAATDRVVPADYDGDGRTDIAVYRPSTGVWYIVNSSTGAVSYNVFGLEEDLPTPADFDGDGKADVSVFRPSTGTWYRQNSLNGSFFAVQFGADGDKPSIGDYDGDGKADVAVYRPSTGTWYLLRSSDGEFAGEQFGIETDKIVPADYDGDGKTDIAVYRPSEGIWYIRNSSDRSYTVRSFGVEEDIPAPGDYDGDGKADLAVFRPSTGTWYIANSGNSSVTTHQWGLAGDIPTPAAFRY